MTRNLIFLIKKKESAHSIMIFLLGWFTLLSKRSCLETEDYFTNLEGILTFRMMK